MLHFDYYILHLIYNSVPWKGLILSVYIAHIVHVSDVICFTYLGIHLPNIPVTHFTNVAYLCNLWLYLVVADICQNDLMWMLQLAVFSTCVQQSWLYMAIQFQGSATYMCNVATIFVQ